MRKFYLWLIIFTAILLVTLPATANAKNKALSIEQLAKRADRVVIGEVQELSSSWNEERTCINTTIKLAVEENIKGSDSTVALDVLVPGGKVGKDTIMVSNAPIFSASERVLLFLKKNGNTYTIIEGKQGKKPILANMLAEEKVAVSSIVDRLKADSGQISSKAKVRVFHGSTREVIDNRPTNATGSIKALDQGKKRIQSMLNSTSTSWTTMMNEGFEDALYVPWIYDYWDVTNYASYSGLYSVWCAGAIYNPWFDYYPNNLDSWLIYGPFDLSDAVDAELRFNWWNDSEPNYDFFWWGASSNDLTYDGLRTSGDSYGWQNEVFDLSPYVGDTSVWIAFNFKSNGSNLDYYEGAFVDNIVVRKNKVEPPYIDSITPASGSAGTGTRVTIKGTHFGTSQGYGGVAFFDPMYVTVAPVISWSDTQIVVEVPSGTSNGDICVISDTNGIGAISNPMPFNVTFSYSGDRWPDSLIPVGYYINANGTPDTEGEFEAIRAAFDTWSNISTSKMVFSFEGTTTAVGFDNDDRQNTISFDANDLFPLESAIAVTLTRLNGSTIVEQDVVFNDRVTWSSSGEPFKYDIQSVMTHEAGHMLCLDDLYGDADSEKTMYGAGGPGEIYARTLEPEDIAGATYIYYTEDKVPPSSPTSLEATASIESVTLKWGAANDNNGIAGYSVYRSEDSGGPYAKVSTSLIQGTNFTDRYLAPDIPYFYVVTALDSANNESIYSNEASATPQKDTIAPNAPTGLRATAQTNAVTLSWNANGEEDLAGYVVYRDTTDTPTNAVRINSSPISRDKTSFTDTSLTSGTTYFYWLTAVDLAHTPNESTMSAPASATPFAPTGGGGSGGGGGGGGGSSPTTIGAPTNLKATPVVTGISLTWSSVSGATGYNIYRREGTSAYQKLNSSLITGNAYSDSTAKVGITYTYYVVTVGQDSKESDKSNEVTASLTIKQVQTIFSDVAPGAWYKDFVDRLVLENIIGGYSDNTFRPNNNISRAEFAKMICAAMGWTLLEPASPSFSDASRAHWAYKYIETAKAYGALSGYPDGTFGPTRNITRAEIATIIAKTLNLASGSSTLNDISSHWAEGYINACVKEGIIGGYSDNAYRPNNTATRAEAAKMVVGTLDSK